MAKFKILSEAEIKDFVEANDDWYYQNGQLHATFKLADFSQVPKVVVAVCEKAEEMDHHPEWSNAYTRLTFAFCTHDAGNKITDLDTKMAEFISEVVKRS